MADELQTKRIIELVQKTNPETGDNLAVDNATSGTRRILWENLLDGSLANDKKAAPAGATGRGIEDAKATFTGLANSLSENPFDVVQRLGGFKNGTHNGITFTASGDGTTLAVSGTATGYAFINLYYDLTKLPPGIKAGGKVRFYITTTQNTAIRIVYACYNSGGTVIGTSQYLGNKDGEVRTIPDGTVGMYIRVGVNSGTVAQNDSITCAIYPEVYESRAFVEFKNVDDAVEELINTAKNTVHGSEIDLLRLFGNFEKTVHNGITFTPTESGFSATGTASAQAFTNIYFDKANLVHGIAAGMNLAVKVNTTNSNLRFVVGFFDETEAYIQPTRFITSDTTVLVPNNAVGMFFRVDAVSGTTLSADTVDVVVYAKEPDAYYGLADYAKASATTNGIAYAWDADSGRYHISGTATASASYQLWHSNDHMPAGMKPGQKVVLIYNTDSTHIVTRVTFYNVSGTSVLDKIYLHSGVISVPETAVGLTLQFVVYSPWTVDEYVYPTRLVDYYDRARFIPIPKGRPKYISFIDDDTTSDTYVERYFNACMHNGVKGNFAVCTARYVNGTNDVEKLQDYEAEGFDLCLHCDTQETYLYPTNAAYDAVLARKNYIRAINGFRTLGLVNTKNAWIIPYGSTNAENMKIAKDLGFDVAFSTSGDTYNTPYDNDVYMLKRTGLSSSGDVSDDTNASELGTMARCKARVDELASDPDGGWLIITTHFNEWDDEAWNSTTDANGYQIGYSRFNDFVQYALSKGLTPISIGEGVSYIKPILEQIGTR